MKCSQCGAPSAIGNFLRWNDNGTLGIRWIPDLPLVVQDTELYASILTYIDGILGLSIRHIVRESVKNVTISLFTEVFETIPFADRLDRFAPLKHKATVWACYVVSAVAGYGRGTVLHHVKGKYSILTVKNPFQNDILAGVLDGVFEFLDGIPCKGVWQPVGENEYLLTEISLKEKPEVSKRLEKEYTEPAEGHHTLETCRKCGVPKIISSSLVWNMSEGCVLNKRTGKRVGFFPADITRPSFRELHKELGEDIYIAIKDGVREYTVKNIDSLIAAAGSGDYETVLMNYLDEMPALGQGYPVSIKTSDSRTVILIGNPFERYMVGGTLQGIYEGCNKRKCNFSMTEVEREVYSYILE